VAGESTLKQWRMTFDDDQQLLALVGHVMRMVRKMTEMVICTIQKVVKVDHLKNCSFCLSLQSLDFDYATLLNFVAFCLY